MMKLEFTPTKNGIIVDEENNFEILIRASSDLKQPSSSSERLPLNLSLVIDRSGSMQGKPLAEAKKCAAMLVDRMNGRDQLSVITYDNRVDVIFPMTKVSNKALLKNKIADIQGGGMTALYDGWSVGADQVAECCNQNYLSRVLLLSDGQANRGLTDEIAITSHCKKMAEAGIVTSTYGLGTHFNENLMTAMATSGQGQSHYGQTAEDLMEPFHEEFDLMEAIIARQLKLQILPEVGASFEVLNGYTRDQEGRFSLPDLTYDADVWALLKIKLTKDICDKPVKAFVKILTATIDFVDTEGAECRTEPLVVNLEIQLSDTIAELAIDETVNLRSIELRAATFQEQAQMAAREGDWSRVDQIMEKLKKLGNENAWINASLERLKFYSEGRRQEEFSKEARYKSSRMRSRSVSRDENEASFSVASESAMPSYLRRKIEQGKKQT